MNETPENKIESLWKWGEASAGWKRLDGAVLVAGPHNDGDSVTVQHGGRDLIFRLYWVDSVEKNPRSAERRIAQARYFGITQDPNGTGLRLAEQAAAFTSKSLAKPFRIFTRMEPVDTDNPAFRAYIETDQGDLAALLVENGLALIKSGPAEAPGPDGSSEDSIRSRLHEGENRAREIPTGGWQMATIGGRQALPEGVLNVTDRSALLRADGSEVKVRGTVSRVGWTASLIFVNFAGCQRGDFVVIARRKQMQAPDGGDPLAWLDAFVGKSVEIQGAVEIYEGAPQIELRQPGQVKILEVN